MNKLRHKKFSSKKISVFLIKKQCFKKKWHKYRIIIIHEGSIIMIEIIEIFTLPEPVSQSNQSYIFSSINFGIAVVCIVSTTLCNYFFSSAGAKLTERLRIKMFESALRQEMGWHDLKENQASVLSSKLATTSQLCQGLTTDSLNIFVRAMSSVGVSLTVSLVLNWQLALVLFVFSIIFFISNIMKDASPNTDGETEFIGKLIVQCTDNIKTVMSLGIENYFISKFNFNFRKSHAYRIRFIFLISIAYALAYSIMFFTMAVNFWYGSNLVKNDSLKVVSLYRIYLSMTVMTDSLTKYFTILPDTSRSLEAVRIAREIINKTSQIDSLSESGKKPCDIKGYIEFQNVHFRYPSRKNPILSGLNLKIDANKTTALVGHSGCGKSTVIQILLRFYDIEQGRVTLDGIDIKDLNINWLRSQIGFVSQEPVLFDTTILENIKMGNWNPDEVFILCFFFSNSFDRFY
jgi:ABC-type multidrug transport system fused ATPase/permease subunit